MPKVSVIVPVYGVQNYIRRCACSLFEQTLDDMEFIFVNDCTKDNSIAVLHKTLEGYPMRKRQVRVVEHSENRGLRSARATGLKVASGEYVIHCDSDDWMDKDMCLALYEKAKQADADVVMSDFFITDGDKSRVCAFHNYPARPEELVKDILSGYMPSALWVKMFRRSLYTSDIVPPIADMGEDLVWSVQLASKCTKVAYVDIPLYFYFSNLSSITKERTSESSLKRFAGVCQNLPILEKFVNDRYPGDKTMQDMLNCCRHNQRNLLAHNLSDRNVYKLWRDAFPGLNKHVLKIDLPVKSKILFILRYLRILKY